MIENRLGSLTAEVGDAVQQTTPIRATIQPGFVHNISIRIVPGSEMFPPRIEPTCAPRGDQPFVLRPEPLPGGLVDKLVEANTAISTWLAKDRANAELFVADPIVALQRSGVELTRPETKALSRRQIAMRQDATLPPGARIEKLTVEATRRGKVGDPRGPLRERPGSTPSGPVDDPQPTD